MVYIKSYYERCLDSLCNEIKVLNDKVETLESTIKDLEKKKKPLAFHPLIEKQMISNMYKFYFDEEDKK